MRFICDLFCLSSSYFSVKLNLRGFVVLNFAVHKCIYNSKVVDISLCSEQKYLRIYKGKAA